MTKIRTKTATMTNEEYDEAIRNRWCMCGSKQHKYAEYDGYGIFLTYVCDKCRKEKMKEFRSDIKERYSCDEPIEPEDY